MAANQTHFDIRYDISKRIATMLDEKTTLASSATRYSAIGNPSTAGDGGLASTGQLLDAIEALQEIVTATAGDPDYAGIAPTVRSFTPIGGTAALPTNIGPGKSTLQLTVRNLLPFPKVVLRPSANSDDSGDINVTAFAKVDSWTRVTDSTDGIAYPTGTISISEVTASLVASGSYVARVQNPLDSTAAVAVSSAIYLTSVAT
jgi:hypothetical protein